MTDVMADLARTEGAAVYDEVKAKLQQMGVDPTVAYLADMCTSFALELSEMGIDEAGLQNALMTGKFLTKAGSVGLGAFLNEGSFTKTAAMCMAGAVASAIVGGADKANLNIFLELSPGFQV